MHARSASISASATRPGARTEHRSVTADDCYFDHDIELVEEGPDIVDTESRPVADLPNEIDSSKKESADFPFPLATAQNAGSEEADPNETGQEKLERGLIKRISTLIDVRIAREKKDILKRLERMVEEKWTERKQVRRAAVLDMMKSLNEGPDGLPNKIQNVVLARVDSVMTKQASKARAQQEKQYQSVTSRLANIEAELTLAKKKQNLPSTTRDLDSE